MTRLRRRLAEFPRADDSVAVVEFALVAVVLLALMLGAMDVGRLLWIQHHLSTRSSDALRYASLRGAKSGHPATAEQIAAYLKRGLTSAAPERVFVDVNWDPDNKPSSQVTIEARYAYDSLLTPIMPLEGIVLRSTQTTVVIN